MNKNIFYLLLFIATANCNRTESHNDTALDDGGETASDTRDGRDDDTASSIDDAGKIADRNTDISTDTSLDSDTNDSDTVTEAPIDTDSCTRPDTASGSLSSDDSETYEFFDSDTASDTVPLDTEGPDTSSATGKSSSMYHPKGVFLIPDDDWRRSLTFVPVSVWNTDDTSELSECVRPYNGAENACAYPVLMYHKQGEAVDLDPAVHFLESYNAEVIYHVGNTPPIVESELGDYSVMEVDAPTAFWSSYDTVVLAQNDYAVALFAAVYASLLNSPLIIEGYNDDVDISGARVIGIGDVHSPTDVRYSLQQAQKQYIATTGSNKILLVSSADEYTSLTNAALITTERSGHSFYDIYGKLSLASPFLASAKNEVMIVYREEAPEVDAIDAFIEQQVQALGIDAPEYLTIVAAPTVIPQAVWGTESFRDSSRTSGNDYQVDGSLYADLNGDYFTDLKVGRIYSFTCSGVSANIARSLHYDKLAQPESFAALHSFEMQFAEGYSRNQYVEHLMSTLGYRNKSTYIDYTESQFAADVFEDNILITYSGHGTTRGVFGYGTDSLRSDRIWFDSSIVTSTACSTLAYDQDPSNSGLFGIEHIRRGAVAYVGGTDDVASNAAIDSIFVQELSKNNDLGTAMQHALNMATVDGSYVFEPFMMLVGDPTFNPGLQATESDDLLHLTLGELREEGGRRLLPVDVLLNAVDVATLRGIAQNGTNKLDMAIAPSYVGRDAYRSAVYDYIKYETDPETPESTNNFYIVKVVVFHDNPERNACTGIENAQRVIGDGTSESFEPEIRNTVTNNDDLSLVLIDMDLGDAVQINQDTNWVPEIRIYMELVFE